MNVFKGPPAVAAAVRDFWTASRIGWRIFGRGISMIFAVGASMGKPADGRSLEGQYSRVWWTSLSRSLIFLAMASGSGVRERPSLLHL